MRIAVFADVHANRPALEAVLAAIEGERVDLRVCLGDLVGYGAEPSAAIALVRRHADVVVKGNHDRDSVHPVAAPGTASVARQVQAWTGARLDGAERAYLDGLPHRWIAPDGGLVAVHGCYLNDDHVTGYVTGTMLGENLVAVERRAGWPRLALCGHTHLPMLGWLDDGEVVEPRVQTGMEWPPAAAVVLANPGSVGQPRDGDPRAAYAVVDLDRRTFELRRVTYDVEAAAAALAREGLPPVLAERLREGR